MLLFSRQIETSTSRP